MPKVARFSAHRFSAWKYQAEFTSNNSLLECDAFAKGVEAVLNHMVEMRGMSPSRE